ncbi:hypothetical protein KI614_04825 [Dechloromonas denitrificans]|uniref:hypothetical protein n=1 Tax=Dechloromonas denitrificans TaxID=281362 RepID=UPI001CF80D17|nr:hypothetical protein [Dechloromonas denitrificans]UCV12546.1 hypothetical protein KI614_04825 [Dechloromonas denitrificans]
MPSPILARADALMQRRRANTPEGEDVPILTDAIVEEDDFPVLLDIETPADVASSVLATQEDPPPSIDAAMLDIITHELTRRINERLAAELPGMIEATVRDFLAEREELARLQPAEPDPI